MPPDLPEEIFAVFIFVEHKPFKPPSYQNIDCHASHANLAPPKPVTVKIDIDDDEVKSQVATTGDERDCK